MKSVILILLSFAMTRVSGQNALSLPAQTFVSPYQLGISYNQTTVLMFPAPVKDGDRGWKDIIASKQPGMENVIKIKAARKGFDPTSLHVFTNDGRVYAFQVYYDDNAIGSIVDITKLPVVGKTIVPPASLLLPEMVENPSDFNTKITAIRACRPFFHLSNHKFELKLSLRSIFYADEKLYIHYRLYNRSNIPYTLNFCRMYIEDKKKTKRSSSQQFEVTPLITTNNDFLLGNSSTDIIICVRKFTIPDAKKFRIELFEKNGGRNISLKIKNRHLFKAHLLSTIVK